MSRSIKDNKSPKTNLFKKVTLGLAGTAAAIIATFISVKAPEINLASSISLNQTPQHSIVEDKVIEKETTTKTQEVKKDFGNNQQTQPVKIATNPDGTLKVQIDKKLVKKSNTNKQVDQIKKFKSIFPSVSLGEPASASAYDFIKDTTQPLSDVFIGSHFTQNYITSYDEGWLKKHEGNSAWATAMSWCGNDVTPYKKNRYKNYLGIYGVSYTIRLEDGKYNCYSRDKK
jgi:hypothetical protein